MPKDVIKLTGTRELAKALQTIPRRSTRTTILRASARAGAKPFVQAARKKVRANSKDSGTLLKSIKARTVKSNKFRGKVVAGSGSDAPHGHLVEFGTGPRQTKSGRFTGSMGAEPWARPAYDQTKGRSLALMRKAAVNRLNREALKFARKAKARARRG